MAQNRKVGAGRDAAAEATDVVIVDPETGVGLGGEDNPVTVVLSGSVSGAATETTSQLIAARIGDVAASAWSSGDGSSNAYLRAIATKANDTNPALVLTDDAEWETVAASATDQTIGATGAAGDRLTGLLVVPATTSPGAVSIKDGAGSAITVFTGGASSVSNLVPFPIPLGMVSLSGAWKVTTGANVSVIAIGRFT